MNELLARRHLVDIARRLDAKGILTATDGNLSIRLDGDAILITPSGCCKGLVEQDQLVVVAPDGSARGGKPSSEIAMHQTIYRMRPDIKAIVHAHPPYATAFAVAGIALDRPILSEAILSLGSVPLVPYAMPTAEPLARSVEPFLEGHDALLLQFHGAVALGRSPQEACFRMETLEHVARIDHLRRTLGSNAELSVADAAALRELRSRL